MKIINKTKYPTKWIKDICNFSKSKKFKKGITIEFNWRKNKAGISGRFYPTLNKITVTLPKKPEQYIKYPRKENHNRKKSDDKTFSYIDCLHLDFEDELVHVVAHELRHAEQMARPKIHKVFGSRPKQKFSERDADAYGIKKQREYRKIHKAIPTLYAPVLEQIFS